MIECPVGASLTEEGALGHLKTDRHPRRSPGPGSLARPRILTSTQNVSGTRGLHDILLYHMVMSDLGSAGCPSQGRLSESPDEREAHTRLTEAAPYVRFIRNTSCYWGVRVILRDLYGCDEDPKPRTGGELMLKFGNEPVTALGHARSCGALA